MQIQKSTLDQISTLKDLPSLPHILLKLIEICNEDKSSLKDISGVIENDPSLTGKILRLVNSAYYGLPRKIENVDQALGFLGINTVKSLAICASIFGAFPETKGQGVFNLKLFWWHSLKCAVLSRLLAQKTHYNSPDEAFLCGLLHDIGRLVLWVNFPEKYSLILAASQERPDLLVAGEIRLGATHCEIGAWLLDQWRLDTFVADSVLYHHEPLDRINAALPLVQIVYVANALSRGMDQSHAQGLEAARKFFGLSDTEVAELVSQADRELDEVAKSLGIEIQSPDAVGMPFSEKDFEKQAELVSEVRDVSLLLGALQNLLLPDEAAGTLKEVDQGLRILFDTEPNLFFLYDPEKEGLLGRSASGEKKPALINDLIVPLQAEKSLLVACLHEGKPLESFSRSGTRASVILDEQIIRFIGKEGILCLPMIAHGEKVGVIVLGVDQVQFSHIQKNLRILTMFANQAAVALHVHHLRKTHFKTVQSERLGASSSMARKVIHEVNNPLSIIKNYLKILGIKLAEQEIAQDEIKILNEEIDRVALILRELNAFSDSRVEAIEALDVNALISDLVKITWESLRKDSNINVQLALDPSRPTALADTNGLKQVLINLIKNASEAMPEGGNLHIQTRRLSSQLGEAAAREKGEYQGYVEVTVSDDGPGIPAKMRARVFEPFVTSKEGGHSGLGLSVVHSIIKDLNGTIDCHSEEDRGTTFKIGLPLAAE